MAMTDEDGICRYLGKQVSEAVKLDITYIVRLVICSKVAVLGGRVNAYRVSRALLCAIALRYLNLGEVGGGNMECKEGWHASARLLNYFGVAIPHPLYLVGVYTLLLYDGGVCRSPCTVGIYHIDDAKKLAANRYTDGIVGVARYVAASEKTVARGGKSLALPSHATGRLVIVIAENGRPRNLKRVHKIAEALKGRSRIIKRAVYDISRDKNEIGLSRGDESAYMVKAIWVKAVGRPSKDLIHPQSIGCSSL